METKMATKTKEILMEIKMVTTIKEIGTETSTETKTLVTKTEI